ncbi:MAG: YidC/Oxa1 family membrane protein insertase [Ruminococcus sp.]|nr:YidC/Oxa1 family membrane protein insertase [Candidatus Copronaster equi]
MNGIYNALYKYISPIFGYIMLFFYGMVNHFNGSYGIAIILFTIFARLFTLPSTVSQQKGMAKQQRLQPKIRRIQEKYAGDQQKIQQETQNLYAREGYNPMSAGCLPMLIQMPFIIGLFGVLYNPLRYAIGLDASTSDQFVNVFSKMIESGVVTDVKASMSRYFPLYVIERFDDVTKYIAANNISGISQAAIAKVQAFVEADRFTFFGLQLGVTPEFKHFNKYWTIPIFSGITSLFSSLIMQLQQKKMNPGQKTPGAGCTMLMMPAMSVWFTFMFPSGIGVYWIASNIFTTIQSVILKKVMSPQKNIAKLMIKESVERRSRENSVKRIKKDS